MSGYTRTTRECSVNQLQPGLSRAIQEYFQSHQVGDAATETRICCVTTAEKRNSGKLFSFLEENGDTVYHLAILMTPDWLIWARSGDRSGTSVIGTKLKAIKVKVFVTGRSKNMQLEIAGIMADSKEYIQGNLELGPELAAQRFCEEVAKNFPRKDPPAKRKLPRWLGG